MYAAGPWMEPLIVPDDPRRPCLVQAWHAQRKERRLFVVKCVRGRWVFADRSWLSEEWTVLRWAYVNEPD